MYTDWDIGLSGALNVTRYDTTHNDVITYRIEPNNPYLGMKVISALPAGSSINYHAIRNDGSQGDINTYSPGSFTRQAKWHAMNSFFGSAGPGDISLVYGLKNVPLASHDSIELVMAIALADSAEGLQHTLDTVEQLWNAKAAVFRSIPSPQSLSVHPDPFQGTLHLSWPAPAAHASVTVYDDLGRIVLSQLVSGDRCELAGLHIPAGVYLVDVATPNGHFAARVVAGP